MTSTNACMTVAVHRMRIYAYHGVGEQERLVGNDYEVTVALDMPPVTSDLIADTISYADIAAIVRDEMARPSMLLEHVCTRLRKAFTERFPQVTGGRIEVAKLTPPIPGVEMAAASITLAW